MITTTPLFSFSLSAKKVKKNKNLNVLLLTIDTLRADRVGYSGFNIDTPNLNSLAFGGARFMNAVCQAPLTLPSHASIFTGTNPPFHGIKNNGPYYLDKKITTLAEILKKKGYLTAAFVGAFPVDSQFGLDQGFDIYDDQYNTPEYLKPHGPQRLAEDVFKSAAHWLNKNHNEKFFIWVHYYDPHDPYLPPSPFDKTYRNQPYEGEIAYTDVYVGKLISLLEEKNIFQKTLIIAVGDHGEDLFEHNEPGHGIFLYDTTLKVPLIFHCPVSIPEGIEINRQVRTIDILPTILEVIRIDIPKFNQGKSLIPLMQGKELTETEESYAETYFPLISNGWSELKAIRTDDWKYIQAPIPELYDLKNDPKELNNLFAADDKLALNLKKRLLEMEEKTSLPQKPSVRRLTQEAQEKLKALGYISGKVPDDIGKKERPDPKEKILVINKISQGVDLLRQGNLEEAEKIFLDASRQDPQNPMVLRSLANIYQKRKEWNKAIEILKESIKENSTDLEAYHHLAVSYFENKRIDEAIDTAKAVLNLHPHYLKSLLFLSSVYKSLKQTRESLVYLEKALQVDPGNLAIQLEYAETLANNEEYKKAIEILDDMIKLEPTFSFSYLSLSSLYEKTGQLDKAIETLQKAVALEIASSKILNKLGHYLQKANQYERSGEILRMAIDKNPNDPEALNYYGINYWHSGQYKKAIEIFDKVISLDNSYASAYNNLGSVYLSMKKYDLARQKFKAAIQHDAALAGPYNGLGIIYAGEGKRALALENWKKAVELDSKQFDALYNLGILLTKMDRFEEAVKYLEQFVDTAPEYKYAADIEKMRKLIARLKEAIRSNPV
ncbi:MAG: tetratricopeptide repeat protein [Candidatus Aminicenantes bacterium]|nr:MAG: tetratricopeptide repeat protein [Candidatus Aminicenantes bacterium]